MINYASTFLSHSSPDKALVEAVARELGRRGILCWLDKNELRAGISLTEALREAVKRQATVTLFLSLEAVRSSWVNDEVATALEIEGDPDSRDRVIPVFLGDPLELVRSHALLKSRWLHPDGDRVDRLGITVQEPRDRSSLPRELAESIASGVYSALGCHQSREVVVCLDQRGEGSRSGDPPNVPDSAKALDAPALVFRPNLKARSRSETLHGKEWEEIRDAMIWALSNALGGVRWPETRNIRIFGDAQLGIYCLLGSYFGRDTSAHLYCTNSRSNLVFNNAAQPRNSPLAGGNQYCETPRPCIKSIPREARLEAIALLLCRARTSDDAEQNVDYVTPALEYLGATGSTLPPVLVEHADFNTNEQVMSYVADVVALLARLRSDNGVRTIYLFTSLPNNALILLAANLLHVVENVSLMEYRRDLQGKRPPPEETFVELRIQ